MSSPSAHDLEFAPVAREIGFSQSVHGLYRGLMTAPAGWLLVGWMAWGRAPQARIVSWVTVGVCVWLFNLWLMRRIIRQGPARARHAWQLAAATLLDGVSWSLIIFMLTGFSASLDPWLAAFLCGLTAINAQIYVTDFRGFVTMVGSVWLLVIVDVALRPGREGAQEQLFGLTLFFVLMVHHMRANVRRALEGIRLQLSNASLAKQLNQALQVKHQEASTDALTGQPNRRALDAMLEREVALATSAGRPFSVLMLDVDHFKQINDVHGHGVGDATLQAFAQRVCEHLRQGDACARYGGEEFVVVLPGTTLDAALDVGERLRRGVAERALLTMPNIEATVSVGVAQYGAGETVEQLLRRADDAVYAAKRGGRNQVRAADLADLPDAADEDRAPVTISSG